MTKKRTGVGRVVAKSATSAINLGVVGAAAVGAVALASWPIAALGGVAYAALVATDVANPDFRRKTLRRSATTPMPKAKELTDPGLRELVEDLAAARADIATALRETPARVQKNLATTLDAIEELAGHAAVLVTRARDLGQYLERVDVVAAEKEASTLRRRASTSNDAGASREYELAAGAANERVAALRDIAAGRERILANLARILATMRSVPPKIVRVRTLDDRATDSLTGDFDRELSRMNTDLRAFEQTLETLAEGSP
jgi:hypothetical protein